LWTFFCLPETKGRTLEEMDEMVSFSHLNMGFLVET